MGQGEERGVWQELVPKIHWALLGCGLEPASGGSSGPSAHALARSAPLRLTGLQLGATTRRQGTAVRPGGSGQWASPAQPGSSSPPTAQLAWRAGPCSASNVRQPQFPAASPGGSTGSTPGASWGMQEVSGQGLAVPVTGAGRRLQRGCVWLSQAGLECQDELEPHQHSCPSSWSRACMSAAGLPLP